MASNGKELLGNRYERDHLTYEEIEAFGLTVVTEKGETVSPPRRPAPSPALSSTSPAGRSLARLADRKGLVTVHGKDTKDNSQTFDVVVSRVFDASVEEAWKAWSDPEYVTRWWGPAGFTSPSAEMDFRVGGASLVCMRAPAEYGGQDMYNTWTYTRIDPHERIEFVSNFANKEGTHLDPAAMGMPPGVPRDVPHVIVFKVAGDDKTEMTVTESGYTTEEARDLSRAGMEQCLDKMAAMFAE